MGTSWSPERLAKFKDTMAKKREARAFPPKKKRGRPPGSGKRLGRPPGSTNRAKADTAELMPDAEMTTLLIRMTENTLTLHLRQDPKAMHFEQSLHSIGIKGRLRVVVDTKESDKPDKRRRLP